MFERVLIIETAGKVGRVAVASGQRLLGLRDLPEARRHARDLTAHARSLFSEQQWQARDTTAIIVDMGPGSFTGLRVGLASAKALAFANSCPLLGVPLFQAIANRVPESSYSLEIIADALQGQIYRQKFHWLAGRWREVEKIEIRSFVEWLTLVAEPSLVAGPGVEKYRVMLPSSLHPLEDDLSKPDCASLLAVAKRDSDLWRVNPSDCEPIYLRGSSAEEKRKLGASI